MTRRLGSNARTRYRVRLMRGCVVVAFGSVRDASLVLRVRATGSVTVRRDGRSVTVATYPRLRGSYLLQPSRSGPPIAVTRLTIRARG